MPENALQHQRSDGTLPEQDRLVLFRPVLFLYAAVIRLICFRFFGYFFKTNRLPHLTSGAAIPCADFQGEELNPFRSTIFVSYGR